jgi:hypothetical protein
VCALPARAVTIRRRVHPVLRALRSVIVLAVTCAVMVVTVSVPATSLGTITSGYPVGDFETVGLAPQGWVVSAAGTNRGVVSTSRAISGSRSLLVEDLGATEPITVSRTVRVRPGSAYHAQGYAYTRQGVQNLSLLFADESGRIIARHSTPSTGASMVWSRVEVHATAPAAARTVVIQVSSSAASVSTVWWDAIGIITPVISNSGFESTATASAPVPGWWSVATGGASATVTTTQARLGSHSLHIADRTTSGYALARSARTPVFPGVSHDVRAWIRPSAGSLIQTIRWYDGSGRLVDHQSDRVSGRLNTWTLVSRRLTAPSDAQFASIDFSVSVAGTGTADVDAVSFIPSPGATLHGYTARGLSQPLNSFSNTNTTAAVVMGGRPKVFTVVSGEPAELQMLDVQTGAVEVRRTLNGTNVGWGLTTGADGSLYVAGTGGHLFRYLPSTKTLRDLGRVTPRATTVWDLEKGPDGRIWGVSYPASELWNYNPSTSKITSLGSVSTTHAYARGLAVDGRYAYVGLGSTYPAVMRVSLANPATKTRIALPVPVTSGTVSEVELLGRYLLVRTPSGVTASGVRYTGERRLYDVSTGSWKVAANMPAQTPSGLDSSGRFYYFSYQQLWAVDSRTGVKTSVASTASSSLRRWGACRGSGCSPTTPPAWCGPSTSVTTGRRPTRRGSSRRG